MTRWPDPRPFAAVVLINTGDGMIGTLVPLYLDGRGFPIDVIGLLVAVAGVTSLLSRLPTGLLYRRRRAQWLMYVAIALQACAATLYALPVDALGFGLIRGLQGFAFGVASTVNMALFIDTLPPEGNRHRHLAVYASALSLGFTFGGLGGGLLGYWLDYGPAFLCAAAISLLAVPCTTAPRRGAERPPAAPAPASPDRWVRVRALRVALTHPRVMSISLVSFFLQVLHHMGQTFVPLYALGIGLNLATIGILRSTHSLANTLARPFGGETARWFGHDRVAVWGLAAIAALLMLTPFQDGLLGLMILFVAIGVGRAAVLVANTVSVADLQDGAIPRGVAVGVYSAACDLGGIAGPIVGGYVAAALGLRAFFWVAPPLTFAAFGLLFWHTQRVGARGAGAEPAAMDAGPRAVPR